VRAPEWQLVNECAVLAESVKAAQIAPRGLGTMTMGIADDERFVRMAFGRQLVRSAPSTASRARVPA
jgi:hypothetical protein